MSSKGKRTSRDRQRIRARLFAWQDGKCFWCECALTLERNTALAPHIIPDNFATLDELMPRVRGGRQRLDNSVVSCVPCNENRADQIAPEWAFAEKQRMLRENPL